MTPQQFIVAVVVAAITMFVLPIFFDVINLTTWAAYALLALSLGFVWGYGGILCFGQTAFFGLGAYVYAITAINLGEAWGGFFLAILIPGPVRCGLGRDDVSTAGSATFTWRSSPLVVTLLLFRFIESTSGPEYVIGKARLGGYNGIPGFTTLHVPGDPDASIYEENLYYFAFIILFLSYLVTRWLLSQPFGRVLVGLRENETAYRTARL